MPRVWKKEYNPQWDQNTGNIYCNQRNKEYMAKLFLVSAAAVTVKRHIQKQQNQQLQQQQNWSNGQNFQPNVNCQNYWESEKNFQRDCGGPMNNASCYNNYQQNSSDSNGPDFQQNLNSLQNGKIFQRGCGSAINNAETFDIYSNSSNSEYNNFGFNNLNNTSNFNTTNNLNITKRFNNTRNFNKTSNFNETKNLNNASNFNNTKFNNLNNTNNLNDTNNFDNLNNSNNLNNDIYSFSNKNCSTNNCKQRSQKIAELPQRRIKDNEKDSLKKIFKSAQIRKNPVLNNSGFGKQQPDNGEVETKYSSQCRMGKSLNYKQHFFKELEEVQSNAIEVPKLPDHNSTSGEKILKWSEYREKMKPILNREFVNARRSIQRLEKLPYESLNEKQRFRLSNAKEAIEWHRKHKSICNPSVRMPARDYGKQDG